MACGMHVLYDSKRTMVMPSNVCACVCETREAVADGHPRCQSLLMQVLHRFSESMLHNLFVSGFSLSLFLSLSFSFHFLDTLLVPPSIYLI